MALLPPMNKKEKPRLIPRCGACGLYKNCHTPKMRISGYGEKGILIIGEQPGVFGDEEGYPYGGEAGRYLQQALLNEGVGLENDCWMMNGLSCRTPDDRKPKDKEEEHCRPLVTAALNNDWMDIKIIIPLGGVAIRQVMKGFYKDRVGPEDAWVGWKIPLREKNCWIAPNFNPVDIIRSNEKRGDVREILFAKYLKEALSVPFRPYIEDNLADHDLASQVKIELDTDKAAAWIYDVIERGQPVAFDYETNMLKPHSKGARIASVAFCVNGEEVLACLYGGAVVPAMRAFLASKVPKIGANCKFEELWSRVVVGQKVNNWIWDTVLSAHHLDNRRRVTSVKFQAFVCLGIAPWDFVAGPYLEADDSVTENRVFSLAPRDLLLYNGIDALVEYKLAQYQRNKMMEDWNNGS